MPSATPAEAVAALLARGATVAGCESITGGMICAALTSVAGSSQVVRGGLVTYATDLKTALARVDGSIVESCGVVSAEVAEAMAAGVREVCGADWGIGVTGVAGPGPSDGVPAGTVWLAVVGPDQRAVVELGASGDRGAIRRQVVDGALGLLCRLLDGVPSHPAPPQDTLVADAPGESQSGRVE